VGAITGPHIINGAGPWLDKLKRLQPNLALFLDPNVDDVRAFKAVCPNTITVGRIYVPDSEVDSRIRANPEAAADWAHNLVMAHSARRVIDYWQIANEVLQFADGLPLLNRFELRRMQLADAPGYKCGIMAFSVGQPDLPAADRMALWRMVYPALEYAENHGHILLLHQYGAPDLWGPAAKGGADWLIDRYQKQVLPRLPYKRLKAAVVETGIDGLLLDGLEGASLQALGEPQEFGVGVWTPPKDPYFKIDESMPREMALAGPAGWMRFTTATDYAQQLINIGLYHQQWADRILGYAVFTLGHNFPWSTYDIGDRGNANDVLGLLAAYYEQVGPDIPPVPPIGGTVETQILDKDGTKRDAAWLKATYGTVIVPAPVTSGKKFVLARIKVTEGPSTLIVRVNDSSGAPLAQHAVALYWADAPTDLTTPDAAVFKTIFKPRANVQWTDGGGVTGYGLGLGSYIYDTNTGGPHAVWLLHNQYQSDALDKVGMLAGTEHRGPLDLTFVLADAEIVVPPTDLLQTIRNAAWQKVGVPFNPDAAFPKYAREHGLGAPVPGTGEFDVRINGVDYRIQPFVGGIVYCIVGDWGNVKHMQW